jgi:hypothetical protein
MNNQNSGLEGNEILEEVKLEGKTIRFSSYTKSTISTYKIQEKFPEKQFANLFVGSDKTKALKYFQDLKDGKPLTRLA